MILDYNADGEACEFYENGGNWFLMLDVDEHPHLDTSDLKPLSCKLKECVEDYLNNKKYYSEDTHENRFTIFRCGRKVGNVYYRTMGTRSDLNEKEAKLVADKICFLLNIKHDFEYPRKVVSCESCDIKLNENTIASFPNKIVGEQYYRKFVTGKYGQHIKRNKLFSKECPTSFTIELDLPEVDMFGLLYDIREYMQELNKL